MALLRRPALPADFTIRPWVNPNAPKGGEITLTAIGYFDSFNPFILRGTAAVGSNLIYDTLLSRNLDEPLSQYGHLARIIKIQADRKGVTFELREGARWHDGKSPPKMWSSASIHSAPMVGPSSVPIGRM
jgi:microcin C transport system substrate-binding protein